MKPVLGIAGGMMRGRQRSAHILDFMEDAIVLRMRDASGAIDEVGRAVLEAPDFTKQIDALRVEALIQDPVRQPITLWLPASQIYERDYVLSSTSKGPARAEAMRRLQSETGCSAEELSLEIVLAPAGEPSRVFATHCQTVREAREYARRWGFTPGNVSTACAVNAFEPGEADFRLPTSKRYLTGLKVAQAAAVSMVILGAGLAGLKIIEVTQPILKAITIKEMPGHMPLPVIEPVMQAELSRKSAPVARLSALQSMPIQRFATMDLVGSARRLIADQRAAPQSLEAVGLTLPKYDVAMRIGGEARMPARARPGRLGRVRIATGSSGIPDVRRAVDQIRKESQALVATLRETQGPKSQRVAGSASTAMVRPTATRGESPRVISAALEKVGPTKRVLVPGERSSVSTLTPSLMPTQEMAEETVADDAVEFAAIDPSKVALPAPRPSTKQAEVVAAAEPTAALEPEKPLRKVESEATQTEPSGPDPEERFAALSSPQPLRRPAGLQAADPVLPKKTKSKPISTQRSPTRVGNAANERGLALDQTNLIGVIEASNGRRALVQLPDGDFRKVARGDNVDGWLVNSIERAAMRLTRKGQNRTLLLVSR